MIDYKKGLKVTAPIVTSASSDKYPTHIDELGLGGYRVVNLIADLSNIPSERSKIGMLAYVLETNEIYILTNTGWNKLLSCDNLDLSLEDIKLDIIDLRYDRQHFLHRSLRKGYVLLGNDFNIAEQQKTIGIDNLPLLGPARFPIPDFSKISIVADLLPDLIKAFNSFIVEHAYLPNPTQPFNINDPVSNFNPKDIFALIMGGAWLPETFIGNGSIINPLSRETVSSSTLAFTKVATSRLFKIFENSSFIVSSKATRFIWENSIAESFAKGLTSPIAKLYGYDNTFDFGANAQALDNIDAGLLKQNKKVDSEKGDGVLVKAIPGQDYVDVATSLKANMQLALIRPELIQDGQDVAKLLSRVARLPADNMPNLTIGKYWKGGANNIPIEVDLPTSAPTDATYVLNTPNNNLPNSQALNSLGSGILKIGTFSNGTISIASGGKIPVIDDYVRPIDLEESMLAAESAFITYFTTQMVPFVPGVFPLNVGTEIGGAIAAAAGAATLVGKNAQSSADTANYNIEHLSNRKYYYTDDYDQKNGGNIWYDASHIGNAGDFRPGIRITSWDSSKVLDNNLFPVSMGLFGYKNNLNDVPVQNGFVWQSYMENNSSNSHYRFPINFGLYYVGHDKGQIGWNKFEYLLMNYDYYKDRFFYEKPVKFNQEVVINSTSHLYEDTVFYKKTYTIGPAYFGGKVVLQTPNPTIAFLNDTTVEDVITIKKTKLNDVNLIKLEFYKDVSCSTKGAFKIPVGNTIERPINLEVGMLRFNVNL